MPAPPSPPVDANLSGDADEKDSGSKKKSKKKVAPKKAVESSGAAKPSILLLLFDILVFGGAVTLSVLIFLQ
jgi:hypothetical protein